MYQPNEPIRGKYLVRMEAKIAEEIAAREARRAQRENSSISVYQPLMNVEKRLERGKFSFLSEKQTVRSLVRL